MEDHELVSGIERAELEFTDAKARHSNIQVFGAAKHFVFDESGEVDLVPNLKKFPKRIGVSFELPVMQGKTYCLEKIVWIDSPGLLPMMANAGSNYAAQYAAQAPPVDTRPWQDPECHANICLPLRPQPVSKG